MRSQQDLFCGFERRQLDGDGVLVSVSEERYGLETSMQPLLATGSGSRANGLVGLERRLEKRRGPRTELQVHPVCHCGVGEDLAGDSENDLNTKMRTWLWL